MLVVPSQQACALPPSQQAARSPHPSKLGAPPIPASLRAPPIPASLRAPPIPATCALPQSPQALRASLSLSSRGLGSSCGADAPVVAPLARTKEGTGLMKMLGSFGPRSSSNLSYWGLAGCVNNESLLQYTMWADRIANYSSNTLIMVLQDQDRATVEKITGCEVGSVLGLPSPRKELYAVNVCGNMDKGIEVPPLTDFAPLIPPHIFNILQAGKPSSGPPVFIGPGHVSSVFAIPILRRPVPPNASVQQMRESISNAWAGFVDLEWRASNILDMLEDGDLLEIGKEIIALKL
ncbi:unnamed protein product [Closterium sp. Naga37s-1]|nr:unnamed protein product [Closterium sp. Naga37s-1]